VFLSLHLGDNLPLEMKTSRGLWRGRSMRGDIKVILPGEERTFIHPVAARFAHLTIEPDALSLAGVPLQELRPHVIVRDAGLAHVMAALIEPPHSQLFEDAAVQAILHRLHQLEGVRPKLVGRGLPPAKLARVLSRINDDLASNVSVGDLAAMTDLSPSQFSALFKASVGEAPHRYQTRRRVERARDLIAAGRPPAQAAVLVGFVDQSHLARHMRKLLGATPAARARHHRS
jgi:AraC family transcriptional regulator